MLVLYQAGAQAGRLAASLVPLLLLTVLVGH